MMKLYFSPGACSMASHIALCESGVKFAAEKVTLKTHSYAGGDYYKVNKKGSVPAIQTADGHLLTEGSAILQFIGDQAPGSGLIPANGTFERYKVQEWLNFIATEIHKGMGPLWGEGDSTPIEYSKRVRQTLSKKLDYLADHFKTSHYLMGDQYTVADAYLFTCLTWTPALKIDLSAWPTLGSYMDRIRARPATQTVMKAEGLI